MAREVREKLVDVTHCDPRPQRYGWAPGKYLNRCHDCKEQFIGDKRAILCAPCAYMRPFPPPADC
jgi:hypothetical protein